MTQQIFCRHFNIHRNDSVPSLNTVLLSVRYFGEIASARKRKPPGREPSLKLLKTLNECVRLLSEVLGGRNAIALGMSDRTVSRILHEDLNFHHYKMIMIQAINDQDTVNRKTVCEVLLNSLDNDDLIHVLMTMKQIFIIVAILIPKTVAIGQPRTLAIFPRNLYILGRLLFGLV